ncbi:HEPN domain-containing protein [Anaerophaga thermohalophila]|jgi:HEPN domain-containing protein|uniref:HEPN domain-containing protein n=1 Tax=Anaerophaga thermohalophila TaxID=177400 RepID=UPI0003157EA9|nr:HEPN domain-containing protein [Anaerophaga thermohalophila]
MNSETRDYLNHWIKKAEEDIAVIQKLTEFEIIASSAVCFHCQQAVEKFLKAFLIANNKEIARTHNIEFLLAECSDIDKDFEKIDPLNLTDFGVDIRYPGDFCYPSEQEVIIYSNLALQIKNLVKSKIKL